MDEIQPARRPWKHVVALMLWLLLAPPVGLWKLWQDKTLRTSDKWRVLVYLAVIPILAYVTFQFYVVNHALMRLAP